MNTVTVTKPNKIQPCTYPNSIFSLLDAKCKQIIVESKFNVLKSYLVGKYSLEGINNFPQNTKIGIQFLENSIQRGSKDALLYYTKNLVTQSKLIPQDFDKAEMLINKYSDKDDSRFYLIKGLIYRHKRDLQSAIKLFEMGANSGDSEAMFYYGKMLHYGDGCQKDVKKANFYFELANKNGCNKCMRYLANKNSKFSSSINNTPYKKSADIIFMLDSANSIESFPKFCDAIIQKLWSQHQNVYFRFGIVFNSSNKFQRLTKKRDDINKFLMFSNIFINNFNDNSDSNSGYEIILNKIEWDDIAEKVVIHIINSDKESEQFDENSSDFVQKILTKGISLFCLNLNSNETNNLETIKKQIFNENQGKFVVQNHFDKLDYVTFESFVCNTISTSKNADDIHKNKITDDSSDLDYNEKNIDNDVNDENDSEYEEYDENDVEDGIEDDF